MDTLQSREEISEAFRAQFGRFADLVRPLTAEQLATPSRCEGWTVGDVAGHFIGSLAEIAAGDLDGQGTPAVTKRQVEARRGWTATQLADEMDAAAVVLGGLLDVLTDEAWNAPAGGGFDGSLGVGIEALLYDGAVHADDIDDALGLGHHPTPAEAVAAVSHVAGHLDKEGWGNAVLALDGMPEVTIGTGDGPRITGNPGHFILAATGRGNPADFGLDDTLNIYR
ncbi:MAG: hypothetical protein QOF21_1599 [Actinomycetota bacterium]|jgi:uncharacterized protein (TIGR03083 family)